MVARSLDPSSAQEFPNVVVSVECRISVSQSERAASAVGRACGTPLEAVAVMDAMDYDVHLFTDAESGEDAVVYRAGPSGLRLERQHRMYPPGWSWSSPGISPPVPLVVNSRPTPILAEGAAAARLCENGLRFLFSPTRPAVAVGCCIRAMTATSD